MKNKYVSDYKKQNISQVHKNLLFVKWQIKKGRALQVKSILSFFYLMYNMYKNAFSALEVTTECLLPMVYSALLPWIQTSLS